MKQIALLKREKWAYGGELFKKRAGRNGPRPLDTRNSMHLVLRSSKAKGQWSFRISGHRAKIKRILNKFALKYGIRIYSYANVGNHLHIHIKLANRFTYKPFIRAITSAIAMAITGKSRWKKIAGKFWDYRPFTRVVESWRGLLNVRDYIRINRMEGISGCAREEARFFVSLARERSTG